MASLTLRLLCLLPLSAQALTPDDAVRQALDTPAVTEMLAARQRAAAATVDAATTWKPPRLSASHGQIPDGETEQSVQITQTFDLDGWRDRRRAALAHATGHLETKMDIWRLQVATAVREAWFTVRYQQARATAHGRLIAHLERGVAAIEARAARGDASPYHVRRVHRALESAQARRAVIAADEAEAWANLRAWTGDVPQAALGDPLRPPPPADAPCAPPEVTALDQQARALGAEAETWGQPGWRNWTVGAGWRRLAEPDRAGQGFMVSLSLPLAFWNPDAPRVARLRAEQAAVEAERDLVFLQHERAEAAALGRLTDTLGALDRHPDSDDALTRMAETAYAAGEASLTELLDAWRSEAELEATRIDLAWAARRAALELDHVRGLGVPE